MSNHLASLNLLKLYCEKEEFMGWDPYDGLNSTIFQRIPFFKNSVVCRLAWIQFFKRSPVNLRKYVLVPKDYNPKAIALFLTGYCNIYSRQEETGKLIIEDQRKILEKINLLAKLLTSLQTEGYSGACWGYNFDWQNKVFFQPKNTPTVVVTSFCADSLFNAYEITRNQIYLEHALSSCKFILNDLNRSSKGDNDLIFSYSPLDQSRVYNASLLGARILARGYHYTKNDSWYILSNKALRTILEKQNIDGSWIYGEDKCQKWIDSFHTGFNLECIWEINKYLNSDIIKEPFERGVNFYISSFFRENGQSKYFHNKIYPIDIHAPAQFITFLVKTGLLEKYVLTASHVLKWTIKNMQSKKGYFYFQVRRCNTIRIPYMRWSQAWMFYALSYCILNLKNEDLA